VSKGRLEAFSDGVIAILITIMVLELRPPEQAGVGALRPLIPVFLSYVLSFIFIGIYWNNHHHMFQAVQRVDGRILWANLHLLFWLSLIPFVTAWMGDHPFTPVPVAMYGMVLLCAAIAYYILARALVSLHGEDSTLAKALGEGVKEKLSLALYILAIPAAFIFPWVSCGFFVLVAIIWLIPDRRIERLIAE
jgi:uncharacterized membrane protein